MKIQFALLAMAANFLTALPGFADCPGLDASLQDQLIQAVRSKNLEEAKFLIDTKGACSSGYASRRAPKPIVVAVRVNSLDLVNLMLEKGASPDAVESDPLCPMRVLQVATDINRLEIAKRLVTAGAPLGDKYCGGYSLLDRAATKGYRELFDFYFLTKKFHVNESMAYRTSDPYILRKLLETGLNPNLLIEGKNSMFYAKGEAVKVFAEFGADPNQKSTSLREPFPIFSVRVKDALTLKNLLEVGANPNARNSKGRTVVYDWDTGSWNEMIRVLAANPKFDINSKDNEGLTFLAYELTQAMTSTKFIKFLVDLKSDVNAVDNAGRTILQIAKLLHAKSDIPAILIAAGAK